MRMRGSLDQPQYVSQERFSLFEWGRVRRTIPNKAASQGQSCPTNKPHSRAYTHMSLGRMTFLTTVFIHTLLPVMDAINIIAGASDSSSRSSSFRLSLGQSLGTLSPKSHGSGGTTRSRWECTTQRSFGRIDVERSQRGRREGLTGYRVRQLMTSVKGGIGDSRGMFKKSSSSGLRRGPNVSSHSCCSISIVMIRILYVVLRNSSVASLRSTT